MKKILLAFLMISTLSYIGCKPGGGGDPKSVLSQFFESLSKNDMEAARKLATKDSKQMLDMIDMGMKMGKDKKDADKFDKSSMEIGDAKIDGNKAVIPVKEIKSGELLNYNLIKEDGSWKVAFDKASVMSMGMEKMNEKGIDPMEEMKNMDMDSLKEGMRKGIEMLDTAKNMMKDK